MKKYYIYTFGCKVNQYESQLISDNFKNKKFKLTESLEEANVIIFNTCTVTAEADKKCLRLIKKATRQSNNPKIIVTGCLVKNKNVYTKELLREIKVINDKAKLFPNPQKQTISCFDKHSRCFLKIQDGCNSFCSYCIIPYTRNILWSKPQNEVLLEIETLVKNGYSEIVLTGINLAKYDEGLSNLIEKITKISLDFRIRISSIELNGIDNNLIKLMKENPEKICRHLHIPLQSGSNEVLKQMDRTYSVEFFEDKTNKILKFLPDLTLTTDIITGFPGETKQNHEETCNFIKKSPFAKFHIFRYSDRPLTKSSLFENKIQASEIKSRATDLSKINHEKRKKFLEKHIGKMRKAVVIGREKAITDNYITINLQHTITPTRKNSKKYLVKPNDPKKIGIFEGEITNTSEF
jgi:threonylcarbamoyladenosine tRNA methylthiotransferase MtaB